MAKCYVCGRGPQYGHNVSHAKNRTNRRWNVNIQKSLIREGALTKKVDICTSCLRDQMKAVKV